MNSVSSYLAVNVAKSGARQKLISSCHSHTPEHYLISTHVSTTFLIKILKPFCSLTATSVLISPPFAYDYLLVEIVFFRTRSFGITKESFFFRHKAKKRKKMLTFTFRIGFLLALSACHGYFG